MIYNSINTNNITTGNPKKFNAEDDLKLITPLYYNGADFNFSLKNKYITVEKIEENIYGKDYITIKSKEYSDIIESIVEKLNLYNPIQPDGTFRATIVSKTKFNKEISKDKSFKACISLSFPTIFKDESKTTLQIHLKDVVVTEIINDDLEVDFDDLKEAM